MTLEVIRENFVWPDKFRYKEPRRSQKRKPPVDWSNVIWNVSEIESEIKNGNYNNKCSKPITQLTRSPEVKPKNIRKFLFF